MNRLLSKTTLDQQRTLAKYCRDGELPDSLEGITPNRLPHYRRLVYGVIDESLSSAYPLTVNLLTEKEWKTLLNRFFDEHACQNPQVWKMPYELIGFVEQNCLSLTRQYPHLLDLLYLEWKEVEYYMMPDKEMPTKHTTDFWNEKWHLNPCAEVLQLNFPVHMKNARFISRTDQGSFHCLIFRQPETDKVKFMNVSPFYAWLVERMMTNAQSLETLSTEIQTQFGVEDLELIKGGIQPFFNKLVKDGMVF